MKLVRSEEEWKETKIYEHEVIFIDSTPGYGGFSIKKQKAPIIAVRDYTHLKISDMTVYIIEGDYYVEKSKIIALNGNIKINEQDNQTIVYPLTEYVKTKRWIENTKEYIDAPEVMHPEDVAFVSSQDEWDTLRTGRFEVIAITNGEIELEEQKAEHIIQLAGSVIIKEGVTLFTVNGKIYCEGGKVFGFDLAGTDPEKPVHTLDVVLTEGEVQQYGGGLMVIKGSFKTPYLRELEIRGENIYSNDDFMHICALQTF